MRIKTNRFREWSGDIRRRLFGLTFREGSGLKAAAQDHPYARTWVAFEGDLPVGWCMAVPCNGNFDLMFYVRRSHRRRGVGRRLHKRASIWVRNQKASYRVFRNPENMRFFNAVGAP